MRGKRIKQDHMMMYATRMPDIEACRQAFIGHGITTENGWAVWVMAWNAALQRPSPFLQSQEAAA